MASFQLVLCLFLLHLATATHVDDIIPLPSAIVSPSNSVVAINNQSFELNCTGTGALTWYRGFNFDTPLTNQSQLLDDNVTLSLTITLNDDKSGLMDERSRTYFCTASNSLGVARSHSVQIPCKKRRRGKERQTERDREKESERENKVTR